ncbi:MAG: hypothetical protein JW746_09145 [Candidatus Krumholzibacteriota bacterium]|nr:hypothetical protein [Candidatus Krumholzibacteriota bacterium]
MRKKSTVKEKAVRVKLPARMIAVTIMISWMLAALAGEVSAQQPNRPRYTEEERKAVHEEHIALIIEKLGLTREQEERLRPLLEEGIGLHRMDRFARDRMSEKRNGMPGRTMRPNDGKARCCRDHRYARRPDDSYHNGRVNRSEKRSGSDCRFDLSPGRGSHGRSFHGRSFHKNDRLRDHRHEHRKAIEEILTKEQIEKMHDIHMELRKEMLDEEASDER